LGLRRGVFTCVGWQVTYGKWHSVAVSWSSINSYTLPFTFYSLLLTWRLSVHFCQFK